MSTIATSTVSALDAPTPTERILTASLVVAPLIYLAADSTYAARGWDDGTAGIIHIIGAIAYGFVALRVAAWLPGASVLGAAIVVVGIVAVGGNVAYGFDAIHQSLGDTPLVDQSGAATVIKPLGLFVPMAFGLIAIALARLGRRWQAVLVLVAAIGWPVGHIANIAAIAVAVNIALVVAFGSLAWMPRESVRVHRADAVTASAPGRRT